MYNLVPPTIRLHQILKSIRNFWPKLALTQTKREELQYTIDLHNFTQVVVVVIQL